MSKGINREESFSILEQAYCAFQTNLPELLQTHSRQWVAYHGQDRVGFGTSKVELTKECVRQGYHYEELFIRMIQPDIPEARAIW